ncbi:MAG: aromatic amino acid exporter YddG [Hyphomicrobiales bacterium]
MGRTKATLIGFIAVLLWALLALFTAASGSVPPFQLAAMTFSIATLVGIIGFLIKGSKLSTLRQPWKVWLLGIVGLFGYHFFYFTALRNAPPVEAGLIAYLWPLLIVLFSALLPGEKLGWHHILGAILGLAGAALIVTGGKGFTLQAEFSFGYATALICALTWSGYSVLSRKFADVPSDVVTGFCAATAVLSFLSHMLLEQTVWPQSGSEWLAIVGLGLGPVGLAFYVWDYGVKNGDIQVLGAASYAAPLLSTFALIVTGYADFTWAIAIACVLITGGAVLAAKEMLFS